MSAAAVPTTTGHRLPPAVVAVFLLRLGAQGLGTMNYEQCTCDEAATILEADLARLKDALKVVRDGLQYAAWDVAGEQRAEVLLLAGVEATLERAA